ncbi:MAG: serine hydrolase [Saprospiraceae bacterium]
MRKFITTIAIILFPFALSAQIDPLVQLIREGKSNFGAWAQDPEHYEIQVIYTQVDRDEQGKPKFRTYTYGLQEGSYFYPASTVKMPAALLALEKLNELRILGLDKWTPMRTGAVSPPQTPVMVDSTAEQLLPSVAHYVRKIFLVSDNDAYNRLYEFLGQEYANRKLQEKGYTDTRLLHRLSAPEFDTVSNRYTNPVSFYRFDTLFYHQGEVHSRAEHQLKLANELRGRGYVNTADSMVYEPFDFRQKNYFSLQSLHDILKAVIFPEMVAPEKRFNLSESDYAFVRQSMCRLPRESRYPDYSGKSDNYVKFWIYGDQGDDVTIPESIRIYNKVGWAYGFLTDVAYIRDEEKGIEFFLAGNIHVNENQIYNDGEYEYEEIGLPFFGELGRAVYEYEQARRR